MADVLCNTPIVALARGNLACNASEAVASIQSGTVPPVCLPLSFPWQRLNINVSDPAFSFLVIRHLNQLQDEDSSYIFHDIINFLLLRLDQDQFFSF